VTASDGVSDLDAGRLGHHGYYEAVGARVGEALRRARMPRANQYLFEAKLNMSGDADRVLALAKEFVTVV
jgi:hypothetical protein